ncbi:hypothetical protein Q4561_07860 [Alteromonas sp. 1_MG-2023]|uniref:COG4648 family protein n=1 Tax=Alteromonas sp. 1_MG-2023 TaxID=3062669 RepID=UPI0026E2680F|nr:hypothetical protein [Alteromonas sp. 1_MG-2023]MDO6566972.1 hypothetical protein [Alteromonas sp. 1_MG-2023]
MKKFLTLLVLLLSVGYPFIVYFGLQNIDAKWLIPLLISILALRWYVSEQAEQRTIIVITLVILVCILTFSGYQFGLKFYPVMMNFSFFILFAGSLLTPTSIVEKFARLKEPDLPVEAKIYTRKVTMVWSVFFIFNGSIACFTALYASDETWMLYNGFIAYILMGVLGATEWVVRQRVVKA